MSANNDKKSAVQILKQVHRIKLYKRKRTWLLTFLMISLVGGVFGPGLYFTEKVIVRFLNHKNHVFHGDYLPTEICKHPPFNALPWCNVIDHVITVDFDQVHVYDTSILPPLPSHSDAGRVISFYKQDPRQKNGQIISPNLRFQYAYNTIVNNIKVAAHKINEDYQNPVVTAIDIADPEQSLTQTHPLDYRDVSRNRYGLLASVHLTKADGSLPEVIPVPVVFYNTSLFYSKLVAFFGLNYQGSYFNKQGVNQTNGVMVHSFGNNIIVPSSIMNSTHLFDVNQWLYQTWELLMERFYVTHYQQFQVTKPTSNLNNPLRNVILYSPALINQPDQAIYASDQASILSGLASCLFNPNRPQNHLPGIKLPVNKVTLLLHNNRLNYYLLILDPKHSLQFYFDQTGEAGLVELLTLFFHNGNDVSFSQAEKFFDKYPFAKEIEFAPWQVPFQQNYYDHTLKLPATWYTTQTITLLQTPIDFRSLWAVFYSNYFSDLLAYDVQIKTTSQTVTGAYQGDFLTLKDPLTTIHVDLSTFFALIQGQSVFVDGIQVTSLNQYFAILVMGRMFFAVQSFTRNYHLGIKNVPPNFIAFYRLLMASDQQIRQGRNFFERWLDNYHGLRSFYDHDQSPTGIYTNQFLKKAVLSHVEPTVKQLAAQVANLTQLNIFFSSTTTLVPFKQPYVLQPNRLTMMVKVEFS